MPISRRRGFRGRPACSKRRLNWNDPGVRAVVYQVVALGAVALAVWFLVSNTLHNLAVRNIATGFGFLNREAGFAIGETLVSYTPPTLMAAPSGSVCSTPCAWRSSASCWPPSSAR